jgi:hypothetical protein
MRDIFDIDKDENTTWFTKKFERVLIWYNMDGRFTFRNIKIGFKNLWKWLPTVWKDRDWDYRYLITVLEFKLKKQSDYIRSKDRHTQSKRDSEVMMTCVRLLKKFGDEYYSSEYVDYFKSKHSWVKDDDKRYYTVESKIIIEDFDEYFKKYPLIHKRVLNGEGLYPLDGEDEKSVKKSIAMNIANVNHNRVRKLVFKIMENNIEKWWD